jgi:hypothetical protein
MLDHAQLNAERYGCILSGHRLDTLPVPHVSMLREANITDTRILPAGIKFITCFRLSAD